MNRTVFSVVALALTGAGCVSLPAGPDPAKVEVEAEFDRSGGKEEAPPPVRADDVTEENARAKLKLLVEEVRRDERPTADE